MRISSSMSKKTKVELQGSLQDFGLSDIVQFLGSSRKTGRLDMSEPADRRRAAIYFQGGSVVHAQMDGSTGEEAFFELMRWSNGEFSFEPDVTSELSSVRLSGANLLMEGARRSDEWELLSKHIPDTDWIPEFVLPDENQTGKQIMLEHERVDRAFQDRRQSERKRAGRSRQYLRVQYLPTTLSTRCQSAYPAPRALPLSRADRFLKACRREATDRTPVWLMRQAGRFLPEYRKVREKYSLLEICRAPEVATQVTSQPVERFELDAAILFSDLLVPLEPMGLGFSFIKGEGPSIHEPITKASDIDKLKPVVPQESLGFTLEAIGLLRRELSVPLIGFAGAPFTLASYAIEGGPSRSFEKTKALMYEDPDSWHRLASKLAIVVKGLSRRPDPGGRSSGTTVRFVGRLALTRRLS